MWGRSVMKIIKNDSKEQVPNPELNIYNPISKLDELKVLTSFIKGQSPEYKSEMDKIFMVLEGVIQLNVNNRPTQIGVGDILMLEGGEKFQFNTIDGAKILQFPKQSLIEETELIKKLACSRPILIKFLNKPIPKKHVYSILKVGMYAPSRGNKEPWKFVVVSDPEMKRKIRDSAEKNEKIIMKEMQQNNPIQTSDNTATSWKKPFLESASILICIFGDHRQELFKESTWLSIGWMILAAENLGLTSKIYSPTDLTFLSKLLRVREPYLPEIILTIGYPDITEPPSIRKDLVDVVSWI